MKHIYRFILIVELLFFSASAMGQTGVAMPQPAFHWRCFEGDTLMNFNPCATRQQFFADVPYAEEYTMVAVYKIMDSSISTVWQMDYSGGRILSLTSAGIVYDTTIFRFSDIPLATPSIHTLRQSAPDAAAPLVRLTFGGRGVRIAEAMYFDRRLGNVELRKVQTAMAMRYGVTLGPVDYIDASGECIWSHQRNKRYHHRITGIGNDTMYNVRQFCSRSEMEGGLVTIAVDTLAPGQYMFFGDDDASLEFVPIIDSLTGIPLEILEREWRIQMTGLDTQRVQLIFDTRSLSLSDDSLLLIVDEVGYLPSEVTSSSLKYDDVMFLTDSSRFTLARVIGHYPPVGKGGHLQTVTSSDGSLHYAVYPNPSTGRYTIEIEGVDEVQVTIYNLQGQQMASYGGSQQKSYTFDGKLHTGGSYYVTITTENGTQTAKLVVK